MFQHYRCIKRTDKTLPRLFFMVIATGFSSTDIRNRLSQLDLKALVQIITSQNDMPNYFQLRFHVWQQMGYLPEHSPLSKDQWEVDRFERFSIPIGLIDKQNRLIACARLVQSFGKENIPHIKTIIKTLQTYRKPYALEAFSLTGKVEQPFDILCEFKGFLDYYRNYVKQNQTDVTSLFGLADDYFDYVVANNVFYALTDPENRYFAYLSQAVN